MVAPREGAGVERPGGVGAGDEHDPELEVLALDAVHRRLGALFVPERGIAVPAHYCDPTGELAAARTACGVIDLSWVGRLELRGRDRHRFLNGLVTSNVKDLPVGRGVYGFITTKQGRVMADVYTTALADRLWLELPAGSEQRVRAHLEGYRVIDDVEPASLDDMALLGAIGPGAAAAVGAPAEELELDTTARARVDGTEVQLVRRRIFGVDGLVMWAPSSLAGDLLEGLLERAAGDGARLVGLAALDALRVEAGVGRWGVDFDQETVANETGLVERAIDFTKGCYLGQEIVARIHYRGKPSTVCSPVVIAGRAEAPGVPSTIRLAGAGDVGGTLTSVAAGAEERSWVGIGTLSRRALDDDRALELDGGGEVRLRQPEQ